MRRGFVRLLGSAAVALPLLQALSRRRRRSSAGSSNFSRGVPLHKRIAAFRGGLAMRALSRGKMWHRIPLGRGPLRSTAGIGRRPRRPQGRCNRGKRRRRCGVPSGERRDLDDPDFFHRWRRSGRSGLVASLARPGGNVTGISFLTVELTPKRLELLTELVPLARVIGLLVNPISPTTERTIRDVQKAAGVKGVQLPVFKAGGDTEFETAFASLAERRTGGLVVAGDPLFGRHRELLVALAARYGIPTIYPFREYAQSGGLISYGPNLFGIYRQAGASVGSNPGRA